MTQGSIAAMLESSCESLDGAHGIAALMLQGVMTGVSRRLLQSANPEKQLPAVRSELTFLACAYLRARSADVAAGAAKNGTVSRA